MTNPDALEHCIAIIGMAGRFPGAKDPDEFWKNLRDGIESIAFFTDSELLSSGVNPAMLRDPALVKAGGVLEDIEYFDAPFFGYSPKEAAMMDPQHRFFLECAWEALENAGYAPDKFSGRVGVYGGTTMSTYLLSNLLAQYSDGNQLQVRLGNDKDFLTTRVSYKLDLRGPSITIQTACSTSLVAVHYACQSLLNGDCDMALAGGVSINVPQRAGYLYQEGGILSPDGHCRAFDARARGTIGGNGVGLVVLRRLADALADGDCIRAVIRGSAINNDGSFKVGYTAPSVDGQAAVIAEALAIAGVEPETVSYVEAHGTGTPLGDPIEIAALTQAFRTYTTPKGFCAVGSVKTNIGHLDAAAGVTGLIKAVLALEHRQLPPSLHFEQANPEIDFVNSPFYINTELSEWKTGNTPLRAGVSSFGMGGTNAHVVLEEAPSTELSRPCKPYHLIVLSARTMTALEAATGNLTKHLQQHRDIDLGDVAYTLQVGRREFSHRRVLVCRDANDAATTLGTLDASRVLTRTREPREQHVVMMFPGQGTQYVNMGRELYEEEPVFREQVDICSELLKSHLQLDLREVLYPHQERVEEALQQLRQTWLAQPALFVVEYALARLWMEWGVLPQAMIGHSIGEYVAACLADVFTLEDALVLVAARGRLMQQQPPGAMLSVPLTEQALRPLLSDDLSLSAVNAPSMCVVAGPEDSVAALQRLLTGRGIVSKQLHTSHAFHSGMMDPVLGPFTELVRRVPMKPPTIPYLSNVTGTWITETDVMAPHYWSQHLRQTVRFSASIGMVLQDDRSILLEVGPGRTLSTLARQRVELAAGKVILESLCAPQESHSDTAFLLNSMGKLWLAGCPINWLSGHARKSRRRQPLPTYPFERQRYWASPCASALTAMSAPQVELDGGRSNTDAQPEVSAALHPRPGLLTRYVPPRTGLEQQICAAWQEVLGIRDLGVHDSFFDLGGDSLMVTQLMARLREKWPLELPLRNLFEAPTVAEQAEVIEGLLIDQLEALPEEGAEWLDNKHSLP